MKKDIILVTALILIYCIFWDKLSNISWKYKFDLLYYAIKKLLELKNITPQFMNLYCYIKVIAWNFLRPTWSSYTIICHQIIIELHNDTGLLQIVSSLNCLIGFGSHINCCGNTNQCKYHTPSILIRNLKYLK